ncbi:MAG: prenyltransferase/squalene oxidase repeat-containing protein [Sediminibacterium sp.]|nr:prenyltransferase/squalene oxidase repeat-containing protein [Sediminibacterium sp.]
MTTPHYKSLLEERMAKAECFLLNSKGKDGYWCDFKTLAGASNEWVSAYVVNALAQYSSETARNDAYSVFKKLQWKRFWLAGWGYNGKVPPDADSTGWTLMAAQHFSVKQNWRLRRALQFMEAHIDKAGGVHTYYNSKAIRLYTKLNRSPVSFEGWCMAHTCVTAAFAGYKGKKQNDLLHFLLSRQQPQGYWESYWWTDDVYATALATEALNGKGRVEQEACERALQWLEQANIPLTPFRAALSIWVRLSQTEPDSEKLKKIVDYLAASQLPDGSWEASAFLRIPPPFVTVPGNYTQWVENSGGGGSYQRDYGRIFTTTTVFRALGALQDIFKTEE